MKTQVFKPPKVRDRRHEELQQVADMRAMLCEFMPTYRHKPVAEWTEATITIPYPPSANRYWRIFGGRAVKSELARVYIAGVGEIAHAAGWRPADKSADVAVYIKIVRPAKRGDLDNCQKILLDALRGVLYADDSQVSLIQSERFEHGAAGKARAMVTVTKR